MWMTRQDSVSFQQEYAIEHKILDVRSEWNRLEIFKSMAFKEIALINEKRIFLKSLIHQESELLAHIAICTHEEPMRVLIAGGFDLEVAFEALKHENVSVDFLQDDLKILHSFISFFPHFQETINHQRFQLLSSFPTENRYDVIVYLAPLPQGEITPLNQILNPKGILITRLDNLILHLPTAREYIANIASNFSIAMPFYIPYSLITDSNFLFLSRYYHPLADINLHRSDMLENTSSYNARIHQSAFVLPRFLQESLKNVIKN